MAVQIAIIGCRGMANGHLNAYLTIHQYESNTCGQAVDYEEVVARNIEVYQKPINERWSL